METYINSGKKCNGEIPLKKKSTSLPSIVMDIFEFELRYLSYKGLAERLHLTWDEAEILQLVKISSEGQLTKKLTETTPQELAEITLQTYTEYKKEALNRFKDIEYGSFTVEEYVTRLEYELKVVKEMWYNTYFLIVQDYIKRAKDNSVAVWPWRWSAAWSLMARCIYITDVDPFPYGLLFERFLNPARVSMPDIDVDFEDEKRYEVLRYVRDKYGEDKFAHIGTFMKLAAKAAFKDVARTMGMPFDRSNALTELISEKTIKESLKAREELQWLYDSDNLVKETIDAAIKLEGNIRQTWVHACGVIIAPDIITKFTSVQYPPSTSANSDWAVVSQYEWHALEDIWLLKMDFLGLRTLSLIKNTIKIINARLKLHGNELPEVLDTYLKTMNLNLPLDDALTFERVLQKGDTSGIFQFEWSGIRSFLVQLIPNNIDDIVAMGALYRPWPMEFIPSYIKRKHWEESIQYMLPELATILNEKYWNSTMEEERKKLEEDLSPILWNTYGIAIYQEQLMFLVQAMAGFSLAEADMLRRWVWKKIKSEIERLKVLFVEKAEEFRDYRTETATWIYEKMIEPAASYSFNKSHSVAYWLISYQTAWLKAHYPIEFNAALLRSEEENQEKLAQFISELQIQGYRILPPQVNESFTHVAAIENAIRLWFLSIKGVWSEVWERIEKERKENWPFTSFEDFITRNADIINKKTLESLAKAGAFHWLIDRQTVLDNVQTILDRAKAGNVDMWAGLFWDSLKPTLQLKTSPETSKMEKLLMEYEVFKTFVSWHPFDWLYAYCKKKFSLISAIKNTDQPTDVKLLCYVKNIQRAKRKWFFVKIEDLSDELEFFVKDPFDWQKFDILIIEWTKMKSLRITKVIRTSLEYIVQEAQKANLYDPEETVADVKAKRIWKDIFVNPLTHGLVENTSTQTNTTSQTNSQQSFSEEEVEKFKESSEEIADDIIDEPAEDFFLEYMEDENHAIAEENNVYTEEEDNVYTNNIDNKDLDKTEREDFDIPNDPATLEKAIEIITNNEGEEEVPFWKKTVFLSEEWYEELKKLLT